MVIVCSGTLGESFLSQSTTVVASGHAYGPCCMQVSTLRVFAEIVQNNCKLIQKVCNLFSTIMPYGQCLHIRVQRRELPQCSTHVHMPKVFAKESNNRKQNCSHKTEHTRKFRQDP
eukprot:6456650-Amphidinium_carterae.1